MSVTAWDLAAAAGCALVAVLLAWPVPIALSRAAWPPRRPVLALLLWQGIALAGGFTMIGSLWLVGIALVPAHPWLAGTPALALAAYLLAHLVAAVVSFERQRRRHLALLELLSVPDPDRARTRVLDDAAPVAYCLPRGIGSVTVLSRGLLDDLEPAELAAVTAHERAHVEQRHEVLQVAFRAWRHALPWFPIAARAETEVAALVEMLADDVARRTQPAEVLARAILKVSRSGSLGTDRSERASSRRDRMHDRFRRLAA
ncbi:M56 family metallopeptidase [Microbacterium sp. Marseille-Q6965]|uniref:M56 family metallopeptidase n=1 Tax=Microbacterium sp. Marseille-Q6965 TaxID=2965072 RepID=UPI0021B7F4AA|nr:M56 family metallopeptidase [Microbacterium sp. Marseille-Q6965]